MDAKPRTVADLCAVTGLSANTVRAYITAGLLPGYACTMPGSTKATYIIPATAYADFCAGRWVPTPRPVPAVAVPERIELIRRKAS